MIVKASDAVGIFGCVLLSLDLVLLLALEESVAPVVVWSGWIVGNVCLNFEITLPFPDLGELLTCNVARP